MYYEQDYDSDWTGADSLAPHYPTCSDVYTPEDSIALQTGYNVIENSIATPEKIGIPITTNDVPRPVNATNKLIMFVKQNKALSLGIAIMIYLALRKN